MKGVVIELRGEPVAASRGGESFCAVMGCIRVIAGRFR